MFDSYPLIQKQFCNSFIIWAHVFHARSWFLPLYDYEIQMVCYAILSISTPSHKVGIWYHLLSWSDLKEKNKEKKRIGSMDLSFCVKMKIADDNTWLIHADL